MKITISATHQKELTTLRGQLAAELATLTKSSKELERLENKQATLQAEIAALEEANSDSETAASSLATKRVQLESVVKKISTLADDPAAVTTPRELELRELLKRFARIASAATAPDIEKYGRSISAKLREYCYDEATAYGLALRTPAYSFLISKYAWPFGSNMFSVGELKHAIARADEILSGELNWTFDAKIK
ncbi:MAG: hypothetical protein WCK57_07115 [Verrucomicrobiae bacterium]